MEKEHEIEKTLQSLDGIERPQPSPLMAQRILHHASTQQTMLETTASVWSWAIGVAALLLINIGMLYWMQDDKRETGYEEGSSVVYFDNELSY